MTLTEKVWIRLNERLEINSYADIDPQHASVGCAGCHSGVSPVDAKDDTSAYRMAHARVIRDPSIEADYGCSGSQCHADIVRQNETSMHSSLWGYKANIAKRFGVETFEECPSSVQEGFTKDCTSCHTTCGQCHVSRPNTAGGGFQDQRVGFSHKFVRTPSEENVCTACHGSRVGDDWNGNEERLPGNHPDLHNQVGMTCLDCHNEDLHGDGSSDAHYKSRYEVNGLPQCKDCHGASDYSNLYHGAHWPNGDNDDGPDVACHVCHSQQYNNCNTCHAGTWQSEYESDNSGQYRVYPHFKIGLNPRYQDSEDIHADSKFITVRHIPVSTDAFQNDPWGIPDMRAFAYNDVETWKYTSPHNLQRWTARTLVDSSWMDPDSADYSSETCAQNCHYHDAGSSIYLRVSDLENDPTGDVLSDEIEANQYVTLDGLGSVCNACH